MRDRLADFSIIDNGARWRAILLSWLAGTIAGAIAAISTNSLNGLAFISVSTSLVALVSFVFSYARAPHPHVVTVRSRRTFMDYAYATIAACFFVALERILTNPETVHAAAARIENNIDGKTPVPEDQITAVRAALEIIGKRNPGPTLRRQIALDYSVVSAASAYNVALKEASEQHVPSFGGFTINLLGTGDSGFLVYESASVASQDLVKGECQGVTVSR